MLRLPAIVMRSNHRSGTARRLVLPGVIVLAALATWYLVPRFRHDTLVLARGGARDAEREPYTAAHRPLYVPRDHYSAEFNAFMTQLHNEVERQPEPWSAADAQFVSTLMGMHERLRPDVVWEDGKCSTEEIEVFRMCDDASAVASDRILKGGAVSPEALAILDRQMIAMLDSPNSDVRNGAVASTFESGLWHYNRKLLSRIQRMKDSDPVAGVRTNIENRLLNMDRMWKNVGDNWEYARGPRQ